jgi:HSP20 family molecular chaperone IbpA
MPDQFEETLMLNFVHYQPWPLMNRWHRELEQAFSRPASASEAAVGNGAGWTPSVDVHEQSDGFLVRADIPTSKSLLKTEC